MLELNEGAWPSLAFRDASPLVVGLVASGLYPLMKNRRKLASVKGEVHAHVLGRQPMNCFSFGTLVAGFGRTDLQWTSDT